jgi:hypothetical protein
MTFPIISDWVFFLAMASQIFSPLMGEDQGEGAQLFAKDPRFSL